MIVFYATLYVIIMAICLYFISIEMIFYDTLVLTIIIIQTLLLYILLALMPGDRIPVDYASDFLGINLVADLIVCSTPSVITIGMIAIIINIINRSR